MIRRLSTMWSPVRSRRNRIALFNAEDAEGFAEVAEDWSGAPYSNCFVGGREFGSAMVKILCANLRVLCV